MREHRLVHDLVDDLVRVNAASPGAARAFIDAMSDADAAVLWAAYQREKAAIDAADDVVKLALIRHQFGPSEENDD